jgi:hypothetical protein
MRSAIRDSGQRPCLRHAAGYRSAAGLCACAKRNARNKLRAVKYLMASRRHSGVPPTDREFSAAAGGISAPLRMPKQRRTSSSNPLSLRWHTRCLDETPIVPRRADRFTAILAFIETRAMPRAGPKRTESMAGIDRDAPVRFLRTAFEEDWVAIFQKSYETGSVAQRVGSVSWVPE